MEETLIILLINFLLFIYFITLNIEDKTRKIYGICQFGLMIPLELQITDLVYSNGVIFGWLIVFILPVFSMYFMADAIYYRDHNKK